MQERKKASVGNVLTLKEGEWQAGSDDDRMNMS
jgi:hypothetical protein